MVAITLIFIGDRITGDENLMLGLKIIRIEDHKSIVGDHLLRFHSLNVLFISFIIYISVNRSAILCVLFTQVLSCYQLNTTFETPLTTALVISSMYIVMLMIAQIVFLIQRKVLFATQKRLERMTREQLDIVDKLPDGAIIHKQVVIRQDGEQHFDDILLETD